MKLSSKIKQVNAGGNLSKAADHIANGKVLSSRFFKKYFFQIAFGVGLILVYISNRYDCVTAMETINALETELGIVRTELQNQRSAYMSSTRESSMQQLVDQMNLGLGIQQQPPYKITYSPNGK